MQNNLSQLLFDDKAILIIKEIADHSKSLYSEELELIKGVNDKRAREFSTGRLCAHQALHKLGIDNFPVLKGEHRAPIWPSHVVGSISHCRELAGAVVANKQHIKSIGLDIENRKQLNFDIARHVCTEEEKMWLNAQEPTRRNLALLLIFSIKEAIFKCVYQETQIQLRFQQCQTLPELDTGDVALDIIHPRVSLCHEELKTRFIITDSHIYSTTNWYYQPIFAAG